MKVTITHNPLVSIGYLSVDVPKDVMNAINDDVQSMIETNFDDAKNFNNSLYGAIQHEYLLNTSSGIVSKFACLVGKEYWKFTPEKNNFCKTHTVNSLWVNYQKKGEFNPFHSHTFCDLSFVIWIKIPFDILSEKKVGSVVNSNQFVEETTAFTFLYPNPYNKEGISRKVLQVDSTCEGKMILFPSSLQHMVYPFFTSEEYRISVAGNIKLED